jgi:hypothetical protein
VADDQPTGYGSGEKTMKRAVAFLVYLAVATTASGADVGRLFFTPTERAQLDVARTQKKAPPPVVTEAAETPMPEIVSYGGIVRRSDGKAMLWINNRLADEKEALGALKGSVKADGAVTLRVPQSGGTIDVKVGQSVDLQSGRVAEGHTAGVESKPASTEPKSEASESKTAAGTAPKSGGGESTDKKTEAERKQDSPGPAEKQRVSGASTAR